MKTSALLLAVLALAPLARAQDVPVDREAWQGMNRSVKAYQDRYKPAGVDAETVGKLWRRLAEQGQPGETAEGETILSFDRSVEPDANGVARNRLVYLVEVETPEPEGDVRRAVYTRTFSHLVASSEDWSRAEDGAARVEIWRYVLSLDGTLHSAVRQEITMKSAAAGARGQSEPDPARSRRLRMRPGDPAVQKRWKELSRELLRLGPVVQI